MARYIVQTEEVTTVLLTRTHLVQPIANQTPLEALERQQVLESKTVGQRALERISQSSKVIASTYRTALTTPSKQALSREDGIWYKIDFGGRLLQADIEGDIWVPLGDRLYRGITGFVAHGSWLYAISDERLFEIDPQTGELAVEPTAWHNGWQAIFSVGTLLLGVKGNEIFSIHSVSQASATSCGNIRLPEVERVDEYYACVSSQFLW